MKIVNVADVLDPYQVYREQTPEARDIRITGSKLYLLTLSGLKIYSVGVPQQPVQRGVLSLDTPKTFSISENGHFAYIIDEQEGLTVVDIRDETNPEVVGRLPVAGTTAIEVRRDFVYIYGQSYEMDAHYLDAVAHSLNRNGGMVEISHRSAGMTIIPIDSAAKKVPSGYLSIPGTVEKSISWGTTPWLPPERRG